MNNALLLTAAIDFDITESQRAWGKTAPEERVLIALERIAVYDECIGCFTATTQRRGSSVPIGDPLGSIRQRDYTKYRLISFTVDNKHTQIFEHQLVWLWHTGFLPSGHEKIIDHIDHNGLNNKVDNLRLVTPSVNSLNRREKAGDTIHGVTFHSHSGKWRAMLEFQGKRYLKYTSTLEEAVEARRAFEKLIPELDPDMHASAVRNFDEAMR